MSTVDAFAAAEQLSIGDRAFEVLFEPAEVLSLAIPCDPPMVGIPLRPSASTRNCKVDDLEWTWERSAAGQEEPPPPSPSWEVVGQQGEYVPAMEDVGRMLRVTARPSSTLGREASAASSVAVPPPRPLLQRRLNALESSSSSGERGHSTFRALSYNILADCYSRHWDEPGSVHSYCDPSLTSGPYRMQLLVEEALAFDADIICLQECDEKWFHALWAPRLEAR